MEIRNNERTIRILEDGKPIDFDSYASIKVIGRARYREECCKPKIAALKQRNAMMPLAVLKDKTEHQKCLPPELSLVSEAVFLTAAKSRIYQNPILDFGANSFAFLVSLSRARASI